MKGNLVLSPHPPVGMGNYFNNADFLVLQYIMEYSPVKYQVSVCQKNTVRGSFLLKWYHLKACILLVLKMKQYLEFKQNAFRPLYRPEIVFFHYIIEISGATSFSFRSVHTNIQFYFLVDNIKHLLCSVLKVVSTEVILLFRMVECPQNVYVWACIDYYVSQLIFCLSRCS